MTQPHIDKLPAGKIKEELLGGRPSLSEESFKSLLGQFGLKITFQRLSILKSLGSGSKTHLTAREVFEKTVKTHPDIGFATVYRCLKQMTSLGILSELKVGHSPARYEIKSDTHHHHLICIHCGKIVEFQNNEMEKMIQQVSKNHQFQPTHHILELYGKCNNSRCINK